MKNLITFLLLGVWSGSVFAAAPMTNNLQTLGELFFTNLASAPFPHPLRVNGHAHAGQVYPATPHYADNRVAIFIPKNFRATDKVNLVVHFHGWRARLDRMLEKFQLIEQFAASGRNAIFVAPQGPLDAPDSFGGKLEDAEGFRRFLDEVLGVLRQRQQLQQAGLGDVILSGHSGGYRVMASILQVGGVTAHIKEVYLFDALYGRSDAFLDWIERGQGRLINIYTKDGGTKAETEKFIATLKSKNIPHLAREEAGITSRELKENRLLFLFTTLDHNQVLYEHHNFRDYLATGSLPARADSTP